LVIYNKKGATLTEERR